MFNLQVVCVNKFSSQVDESRSECFSLFFAVSGKKILLSRPLNFCASFVEF